MSDTSSSSFFDLDFGFGTQNVIGRVPVTENLSCVLLSTSTLTTGEFCSGLARLYVFGDLTADFKKTAGVSCPSISNKALVLCTRTYEYTNLIGSDLGSRVFVGSLLTNVDFNYEAKLDSTSGYQLPFLGKEWTAAAILKSDSLSYTFNTLPVQFTTLVGSFATNATGINARLSETAVIAANFEVSTEINPVQSVAEEVAASTFDVVASSTIAKAVITRGTNPIISIANWHYYRTNLPQGRITIPADPNL